MTIRSTIQASLCLSLLAAPIALSSCSSTPDPVGENPHSAAANPGEKLVFSYPGALPKWIHEPGVENDEKIRHFTGISRKFATESDARQGALDNARVQIAEYLGTDVKRLVREVTAYVGASSEILDPGTVSDAATRLATEATVLGTAGKTFYAEKWQTAGDSPEMYWKVFVSVPLNRGAEYDLAINDLKAQLKGEKEEKKQRNIESAIKRLEELKAKGWFDK
ncbi:MAG: hypothetical protein V3U11_07790 [Planctomycetota bacterium]